MGDMNNLQEQEACRRVEALLASGGSSSPGSVFNADDVREYLQALELVPNTLRSESKTINFLRIEHGQIIPAAQRLARYWTTRKLLFGDRWLLPMTQTGTGALQPREIQILRSGYIKYAPTTIHGACFIADFSLLPPDVPRFQPQVLFYLFSTFPGEITPLFCVRQCQRRPALVFNGGIRKLLDATAVRFKPLYVAQVPDPGKEHLLDYLGYQQKRFAETNFRVPGTHIAERCQQTTALKLVLGYGFERTALPPELGGNLDQSRFDQWVRMRLSLEEIMGAAPIGTKHGITLSSCPFPSAVPMLTSSSSIEPCQHSSACNPETAKDATTKDNGKNNNNTKPQAKARAKKVKKQNQRDKEYLFLTKRPDETEKEFTKRKNAIYVRRNYHRQKMEILAAQGKVQEYETQNKVLREDNDRLQDLLDKALALVDENVKQTREEKAGALASPPGSPTLPQDQVKSTQDQVKSAAKKDVTTHSPATSSPDLTAEDSGDDDSSFASILGTATDMDISQVEVVSWL